MSRDHSQNHYGPNASFDGYDSDLASAGILIESLRQQLSAAYEAGKRDVSEDLEQAAFEKWLYDKCPSGDVESVQRQWLKSYEYAEFADKLDQAAQIEMMRQQLAAALAACKLKDGALQNCEGMLDELRDYPITHDAIIEALAIQPDDSALKAWLGKAVCFYDGNTFYADERSAVLCMADMSNLRPLYHPKELK